MNWIDIKLQKPDPNQRVLVVLDYRKWRESEKRVVQIAYTHFAESPIDYGGPNSLTGKGKLQGLYFSTPAIVHSDVVTHWAPMPDLPWD